MMNKNERLHIGEPKTYGFELTDPQVQFCLHRGAEWADCYLLIKLDQEFVKIKPSSAKCLTESALKVLFCHLFNLADNGNICLKSLRNQELDAQFRNYLKDEKGEEI